MSIGDKTRSVLRNAAPILPLIWMTIAALQAHTGLRSTGSGFLVLGAGLLGTRFLGQPAQRSAGRALLLLAIPYCYVAGNEWSLSIDLGARGQLVFVPATILLGAGTILSVLARPETREIETTLGAAALAGIPLLLSASTTAIVLVASTSVLVTPVFLCLSRALVEFTLVVLFTVFSSRHIERSPLLTTTAGVACISSAGVLLARGIA